LIQLDCCSAAGAGEQNFEIRYRGKAVTTSLQAGVVGTYV
jgi:hypothetical protein